MAHGDAFNSFRLWIMVVFAVLGTSGNVAAKPGAFDGNWMVRVTGEEGECRVAYSLAFQLIDGRVVYVGSWVCRREFSRIRSTPISSIRS